MTLLPISIVGEAWGENEARIKHPLVGPSGVQLMRLLSEAGIMPLTPGDQTCISKFYSTTDPTWLAKVWRAHPNIHITNVFNFRPAGNDIAEVCGPKATAIDGYPLLEKSRYVRAEFEPELDRLASELMAHNPNLILCLGNTPMWALGGRTGIKKWRGTTFLSSHCVADFKCLC